MLVSVAFTVDVSVVETVIVATPEDDSVAETFGSATDPAKSTEEFSVDRVDKG